MQIRRAGEVRVGVERDLDPVVAGAVDHRQQLRRLALVDLVAEVRVGEVERHAGAPRDLDAVGVRLERTPAVIAVVRRVVAAVLAHDLEQRDDLVVVGIHARACR